METSHMQQEIYIKAERLEWVDSLRYLGITITKERKSEAEIKSRIAFVIATLVKINRTWQESSASKVKLRIIEYDIHLNIHETQAQILWLKWQSGLYIQVIITVIISSCAPFSAQIQS